MTIAGHMPAVQASVGRELLHHSALEINFSSEVVDVVHEVADTPCQPALHSLALSLGIDNLPNAIGKMECYRLERSVDMQIATVVKPGEVGLKSVDGCIHRCFSGRGLGDSSNFNTTEKKVLCKL
jgi:hypothetical protein